MYSSYVYVVGLQLKKDACSSDRTYKDDKIAWNYTCGPANKMQEHASIERICTNRIAFRDLLLIWKSKQNFIYSVYFKELILRCLQKKAEMSQIEGA